MPLLFINLIGSSIPVTRLCAESTGCYAWHGRSPISRPRHGRPLTTLLQRSSCGTERITMNDTELWEAAGGLPSLSRLIRAHASFVRH